MTVAPKQEQLAIDLTKENNYAMKPTIRLPKAVLLLSVLCSMSCRQEEFTPRFEQIGSMSSTTMFLSVPHQTMANALCNALFTLTSTSAYSDLGNNVYFDLISPRIPMHNINVLNFQKGTKLDVLEPSSSDVSELEFDQCRIRCSSQITMKCIGGPDSGSKAHIVFEYWGPDWWIVSRALPDTEVATTSKIGAAPHKREIDLWRDDLEWQALKHTAELRGQFSDGIPWNGFEARAGMAYIYGRHRLVMITRISPRDTGCRTGDPTETDRRAGRHYYWGDKGVHMVIDAERNSQVEIEIPLLDCPIAMLRLTYQIQDNVIIQGFATLVPAVPSKGD